MIGAGIGASVSGTLRADQGTSAWAWIVTAVLCGVAGGLSLVIRGRRTASPAPAVVSW